MKGFLVSAVVGTAFLLAPDGWIAGAEARSSKARADLVRGTGAGASDAEGSLEVKRDSRGDRLKVRVRNLAPRTRYEVRDAATGDSLGSFRTNRSGKGRARFAKASLSDLGIEICENGSDEPVLEGDLPDDGEFHPPWEEMSFRTGTVSTEWDAAVQAAITLTSTGDPESEEGTWESIDLWVSGVDVEGPVTLWIADDEGVLRQVASVEAYDWTDPMPLPPGGDPAFGDGNGMPGMDGTDESDTTGSRRHGRRARKAMMGGAAGANCPVDGGGDDGTDWIEPDAFFSWSAYSPSEEGLPFGLPSAADFTGRAFEVRDGAGNVILSGDLPVLEEVVFEPMPMPDPTEWPGGSWTDGNVVVIGFDGMNLEEIAKLVEAGIPPELQALLDEWMALLNSK